MKQYLDLLSEIKQKGTFKPAARENMPGTLSLFGYQFRHDLSQGFPLLTTKQLNFKSIVHELLWFLSGGTNIKYLVDNGCNIWNEDAYNYYLKICKAQNLARTLSFELFVNYIKKAFSVAELAHDSIRNSKLECPLIPSNYTLGDCGAQYGKLWRDWDTDFFKLDQMYEVIKSLRNNPMSRRHIVTAWNPATLNDMALNACHALFQFNCRPIDFVDRAILWENRTGLVMRPDDQSHEFLDSENVPKHYLDCQMYQRSADVFLGVPYNIASYALLTHMVANQVNMIPGDFIHTFGDVHIYENHMDAVCVQLDRIPEKLPELTVRQVANINFYSIGDFELRDYLPQPSIKAKLSTGLK